jgi:hypothetical protein
LARWFSQCRPGLRAEDQIRSAAGALFLSGLKYVFDQMNDLLPAGLGVMHGDVRAFGAGVLGPFDDAFAGVYGGPLGQVKGFFRARLRFDNHGPRAFVRSNDGPFHDFGRVLADLLDP